MDSGALGGLSEFLSDFGTGLGEWGFDIWNDWFGDDVPPPPDNSGSLPMVPQEDGVPLPVLGAEATPDEGVELFWGGSHIGTWDASTGEVTMEDGWDLMLDGGLIQAIEGAVGGMDGSVTGFGGAVPGYAP